MDTTTGNATLRCYAEGYYPDDITVSLYTIQGTCVRLSGCDNAPFHDGTYRKVCDYACPREYVRGSVCHVLCLSSNVSIYASLDTSNETATRTGTSRIVAYIASVSCVSMVIVVSYWIRGGFVVDRLQYVTSQS